MEPIKSIGEFKITIAAGENSGEEFFFKPSFANIMQIGSPREIVESYAILNGSEINEIISRAFSRFGLVPDAVFNALRSKHYGGKVFSTALRVMSACCYADATPLIGYYKPGKSGLIYSPGLMPIEMIIASAKNLLDHGLIGKADFKVAQRDEKPNEYSNEFDAMDYVDSARIHFGMSKSEALDLSMTEFHRLLKQKYPTKNGLTRDEYDAIADDYFAAREERRRLAKEAENNGR